MWILSSYHAWSSFEAMCRRLSNMYHLSEKCDESPLIKQEQTLPFKVKLVWNQACVLGVPRWHSSKESACHCRRYKRHKRQSFDPWVRKIPREGYGNPLQYSCLENPTDRGAQWATVHSVAKNQIQLSNEHFSETRKGMMGPKQLYLTVTRGWAGEAECRKWTPLHLHES